MRRPPPASSPPRWPQRRPTALDFNPNAPIDCTLVMDNYRTYTKWMWKGRQIWATYVMCGQTYNVRIR